MNTGIVDKRFTEREIAESLKQYIDSNNLPPGTPLATTAKLADRYNVSEKTIHRAVGRLVKQGLVYRIQGSGSFVSRSTKQKKSLKVGAFFWKHHVEISALNHAAFKSLPETIFSTLTDNGHKVEIFFEDIFYKDKSRITNIMLETFDVIIASAGFLEVAEKRLCNFSGPVILIEDDIIHPGPWHQVTYDYHPGFKKALTHLKDNGTTKLAVAGIDGLDTSSRRFDAVMSEALKLGFKENDVHKLFCKNCLLEMAVLVGRECGKKYLEMFDFSTAIVSLSDFISIGLIDIFNERGITAGKDVKIISYDNLESKLPPYLFPARFTSITHPVEECAQAIIKMFNDVCKDKDNNKDFYRIYMVPAQEFVIRDTTY
jgi:DNA-binding LacI/PurR family transcriptional regulator